MPFLWALLRPKRRLLPRLQRGPPFLFALARLSLSLVFGFFVAFLVSPFLRLPELFFLNCGRLPLGSFESFSTGGELSLLAFGFGLRPTLLFSLRRQLTIESFALGCEPLLILF